MATAQRRPQFDVIEGSKQGPREATAPEVITDEPPQPQTSVSVDDDGTITIKPFGEEKPQKQLSSEDFNRNLAEDMDPSALAALAAYLLEGIEADIESRRDWADTANRAADYLGVKLQDPTTSVSADGTVCKTVATCMLEAAVKLWGTGRAELLPVGGPVKVRRDDVYVPPQPGQPQPSMMGHNGGPPLNDMGAVGPTPTGIGGAPPPPEPADEAKDGLASALEKDMNWYLTVRDREYYPDFSKMLMSRAVIGVAFRKVFRCPIRRRPVSVWVRAQDLIVSNDCSHLQGAGRVTERVRVRQSTMRRLQVAGHYLDVPLVMPTGQVTETEISIADSEGVAPAPQLPQDFEHMVYECNCEIGSTSTNDLIGDLAELDSDENGVEPGYPLPYRVSIDSDSRTVLEIRRNWKQGDEDHIAKRRYVKYGFIPAFGFYDWGLIHLVGNPTLAATMIKRASVDASLFANFPGGVFLKGPGSRQTETVIRPNPGQFIGMDAGGATRIQDVMQPMPYKEPSAQQIGLGQMFEADVKRLAGVIEIPVADGRMGNTPVGTIMAYIDAVSQVPGAVHKDDHIAQAEEFELLRELLAEEPDQLTRGNKTPARQAYTREELMSADLSPQADPNTPSEIHRLMKKQAMVAMGGLPQFNGIADNRAIYRSAMRLLSGGDPSEYEMPMPPPGAKPPPDPKAQTALLKAQTDAQDNQTKLQVAAVTAQGKAAELAVETQQRQLDRESEEARAAMTLEGKRAEVAQGSQDAAADRAASHAQHLDNHALAGAKLSAALSGPLSASPNSSPPPEAPEGNP